MLALTQLGGFMPWGFSYIITKDADWSTIPAGLLSGGGRIGIAPGNYAAVTLSMTPSAPLTFRAINPANRPVINEITISGGNIVLERLDIVSTRWDGTIGSCIWATGSAGDLTVRDCLLSGNYRGATALTIDPTIDTYPEYACIAPLFNASGVITGFEIPRPNVSGLLADGTYNMIFNASVTGASATFTVSGGSIVSTSLTSGGTSAYTTTTGIGIRSAIISWTGQQRMINYLPFGFRSNSTATFNNLTIERCRIQQVNSAIKVGARSSMTVHDCDLDLVYQDFISLGTQTGYPITLSFNRMTRPFAKSGDPGDPHGDFNQFFMNDLNAPFTDTDWPRITIVGNFMTSAACRGTAQVGLFGENPSGIYYERPIVWGNFGGSGASLGISFDGVEDALIGYNTIINGKHPTALGSGVNIQVPTLANAANGAAGKSLLVDNIFELVSTGSAVAGAITQTGNVLTGENGVSISYASVFASPASSQATLANAQTNYAAIGVAAGKGAFNAPGVNFATKIMDWTAVPAWWRFESLGAQTLSTLVSSNWSTVIWGPSTDRSISITGGEYRIADDRLGTNAGAWTSSSGTIAEGKAVQVRHTTSGSGATSTTTTLTIGGVSRTFVSTTVSAAAFVTIDNQATAYSRISTVSSDTAQRKLIMAFRMRADTLAINANLISDAAASTFRVWTPGTTSFRAQLLGATRAQLRPTLTANNAMKTHIISLDFTNTTANQGCFWATIEDGVVANNGPGTGGTFDTRSVAGTGTDYGSCTFNLSGAGSLLGSGNQIGIFGESDGGGVLFDGAFEFFWMDWGGAGYTLPDLTVSSVRNLWLADNIGSTGQGPTGSTPKLYYTATDLTEANSGGGIPNKGTIASVPLIKQAGTYA